MNTLNEDEFYELVIHTHIPDMVVIMANPLAPGDQLTEAYRATTVYQNITDITRLTVVLASIGADDVTLSMEYLVPRIDAKEFGTWEIVSSEGKVLRV